jgi:nicotinamidase-related amidase
VGHTEDTPPRRALLLIDFQYDFLSDEGRMPIDRRQVQPVVRAAQTAIERAQGAGDLIIKIGNEFRPGDLVGNALRHHAAMAGSPGADWDPRVDAEGSVYVAKWKSDAFCNPKLNRLLEDGQIEQVCLSGMFARACVTATAKAAMAQGLQVELLVDAIACKSNASRSAALARLARRRMQLVAE